MCAACTQLLASLLLESTILLHLSLGSGLSNVANFHSQERKPNKPKQQQSF